MNKLEQLREMNKSGDLQKLTDLGIIHAKVQRQLHIAETYIEKRRANPVTASRYTAKEHNVTPQHVRNVMRNML